MWNYTIASAALAEDSDGEAQAEADGEVHRRLVEWRRLAEFSG